MKAFVFAGLGLSLILAATIAVSADKENSAAKVVCPVSGESIDKSVSSDYGGGKVWFCCTHCKAKFDANKAKFATKANLQLAASGQAKQIACPFSGKGMKAATLEVAGVDVGFCCNNCKAKIAAAKPDEQLKMVFADKPFSKAFKVGKN